MVALLPRAVRGIAVAALLTLIPGVMAAEEGKERRKTLRIGKDWSLTANQHTKEMDGKKAKLLTATGQVVLKHGVNLVKGPFDVEAKAQKIEADFTTQKFVLTGAPSVEQKDNKGAVVKSVQGEEATTIEIDFTKPDALRINGQHKLKLSAVATPLPAAAPAKP